MLNPNQLVHSGLEIGCSAQAEKTEDLNAAEPKLPDNIRGFINAYISSVETLEILLLLHADPAEEWTALEVSRKLCTTHDSAKSRLAELEGAKLLVSINTEPLKHRFNRENVALVAIVGELEKVYKERRVSVISSIYSKPSEPLRAFSDAFRLRKDEK